MNDSEGDYVFRQGLWVNERTGTFITAEEFSWRQGNWARQRQVRLCPGQDPEALLTVPVQVISHKTRRGRRPQARAPRPAAPPADVENIVTEILGVMFGDKQPAGLRGSVMDMLGELKLTLPEGKMRSVVVGCVYYLKDGLSFGESQYVPPLKGLRGSFPTLGEMTSRKFPKRSIQAGKKIVHAAFRALHRSGARGITLPSPPVPPSRAGGQCRGLEVVAGDRPVPPRAREHSS